MNRICLFVMFVILLPFSLSFSQEERNDRMFIIRCSNYKEGKSDPHDFYALNWDETSFELLYGAGWPQEVKSNPVVNITVPGAAVFIKDPDGNKLDLLVLGGRDSATPVSNGIIHILVADPNTHKYTTAWTWTEAGHDFIGIAYSDKAHRLYLLDALGYIRFADFDAFPDQGNHVFPTGLGMLVTPSQCSELLDPRGDDLYLEEEGSNPVIALYTPNWPSFDSWLITDNGSAPPTINLVKGTSRRTAIMDIDYLKAGDTSVKVKGPIGAVVNVVHLDDPLNPVSIGSAILTQWEQVIHLDAGKKFEYGKVYGLTSSLYDYKPSGKFYTPEIRIGAPEDMPNGCKLKKIPSVGLLSYVGNETFFMSCEIKSSKQQPVPVTYAAYCLIGVDGITPIVDLDPDPEKERLCLSTNTMFSTNAAIYSQTETGYMSVRMPIPDDPALAGSVMLYQWIVFINDNVYCLTDIAGFLIRDHRWIPPSFTEESKAAGARKGPSKRKPVTPDRKARIFKWLSSVSTKKCPFVSLPPGKKEAFFKKLVKNSKNRVK